MPLTYLIDENLRGDLADSLLLAAQAAGFTLDLVQVGDPEGPALGTPDPDLLRWCQLHHRTLISRDFRTLPQHLLDHLAAGGSSPGIFLIRAGHPWHDVLNDLILLALVASPDEFRNQLLYIPL